MLTDQQHGLQHRRVANSAVRVEAARVSSTTWALVIAAVAILAGCQMRIGGRDSIFNKTGEQFFTEAKALNTSGDWLSAAILLSGSASLHVEADRRHLPYFPEYVKLARDLEARFRTDFPMTVETTPPVTVYHVRGVVIAEEHGVVPKINFVYPASIKDDATITALAESLHAKMIERFPSLRSRWRVIVYTGFTEPPIEAGHRYDRFGTAIETATGHAQRRQAR